jgi:hypothetical protein
MPATPKEAKKPSDRKSKKKPQPGFGRRAVYDLDLPSGFTVQVKRPGVQGLTKAGVLESLDSLTSIVQGEVIPKAEGKPEVDIKKIMADPEQLNSMLEMMDKIVVFCVVEPKLSPKPIVKDADGEIVAEPTDEQLDAERDEDLAYVDLVDDEDKTYIMNFALGGAKDLATFRQATKEALASARDGEAAPDQAE